jgi:hypothetical protein
LLEFVGAGNNIGQGKVADSRFRSNDPLRDRRRAGEKGGGYLLGRQAANLA